LESPVVFIAPDFCLEARVRIFRITCLICVAFSPIIAQSQQQKLPTEAQSQSQDWIPQAIYNLGQTASSHSDFTFDHSMLVIASKVDQDDDSLRRVIAGVDGVSVHHFRFQSGAVCDPAILDAIRQQYQAAGWEHLARGHNKQGELIQSDVWFHLENAAIRKVAYMVVGRDQINFVTISGSISPIDLLHLSGHFGIPPIQGGAKIPNTTASQAPSQRAY
jgi:hypothetical protein